MCQQTLGKFDPVLQFPKADALGLERLWLFTPHHAGFYAKLGWRPVASSSLRGTPVTLMTRVPAEPGRRHASPVGNGSLSVGTKGETCL